MKKSLVLIVSMLFVLGLAAAAFAIHAEIPAETQAVVAKGKTQLTIGGSVRVRGELQNNLKDALDDDKSAASSNDDHVASYNQRVRIKLDAKVADNVQALVHLESSNESQSSTSSSWTWGGPDRGKAVYRQGNAKPSDVHILEAWILWNATDNAALKIGHMPIALGNKLFYDHTEFGDDAILVLLNPMENTHVTLHTLKIDEGSGGINDDADAYGVILTHSADMFNASADITYLEDGDGNLGAGAIANDVQLWNIGVRGDIAPMDNVTVRGEFDIQFGQLNNSLAGNGLCAAGQDCDLGGYAFLIAADVKLDPATLTLEWAHGTGDDSATDEDVDLFITSLSSTQYRTYVYDYRTVTSAGNTSTGVANTSYIGGIVSAKLNSKVKAKAKVYYLKAAEDVNMQSFLSGDAAGTEDDDLGWEVDGKVSVQLAKNLEYWVEGGILFTGDAYDGANETADNMYAIRNGVQVKF